MAENKSGLRTRALSLAIPLWLAAIAVGEYMLLNHEKTPGTPAAAPAAWPAASALERVPGKKTFIMFVHPKCPCTRASVGELSRLTAHANGKLDTLVVFMKPDKSPESWSKTDLWDSASAIPGVRAVIDRRGKEAAIFSAVTSGQSFLYGEDGRLLFSGGITMSRGHAGDNAGRAAVEKIALGSASKAEDTPVFGCPLKGEEKP